MREVLNQVILRAIKNKKIDVYGGLKQFRSNLFVTDAIIMMIKSLSHKKNQIYTKFLPNFSTNVLLKKNN